MDANCAGSTLLIGLIQTPNGNQVLSHLVINAMESELKKTFSTFEDKLANANDGIENSVDSTRTESVRLKNPATKNIQPKCSWAKSDIEVSAPGLFGGNFRPIERPLFSRNVFVQILGTLTHQMQGEILW